MKVLVVGCGSVGKRHIRNFLQLKAEVCAVDSREDRLDEVRKLGVANCFHNVEEVFQKGLKPKAAVIATPPKFHISQASNLLDHGCDVLIEKPLAKDLDGVDEVIEKAKRLNKLIMTGYTYRFWKPLIFMKRLLGDEKIGKPLSARISFDEYLPDWHPWEKYQHFYMASEDLGGGALLDSSHALDIARWFFGEVKALCGTYRRISRLEIETDDFVEVLMEFENNVVCSAHMDLVSRAHGRDMNIIGEEGNLFWDFHKNEVRLYDANTKKWETFAFQDERNEMFVSELSVVEFPDGARDENFRGCLKKMKQVIVSKRLKEIQNQISKAESTGDLDLVTSLIQSYQELLASSKAFEKSI